LLAMQNQQRLAFAHRGLRHWKVQAWDRSLARKSPARLNLLNEQDDWSDRHALIRRVFLQDLANQLN